jgi:TIR domain
MAYRVFLTYSLDPSEQALAWRLQTLAAAHGIELFVPQRGYLVLPSKQALIDAAIDRADCVLAIITAKVDETVQRELSYARSRKKIIIPIVQSEFAKHPLTAQFGRVFTFAPTDNPGTLESEVIGFLKEQDLSKDKQQAIGALVAVGIGLLLLFSFSEK